MSNLTLAFGRPTLADRLFSRSLVTDLILIAAGTALTSIAAQLIIPLWPVPITGQTFAVLLVGSTLGAVRGALSMTLYLVLGAAGLPVFAAGGHGSLLASPSGGFVIGFVFAAALTGWLAQREWDRKVVGTFLSFAAGTVVIYAFGLPWLYTVLGTFPPASLSRFFGTTNLLRATITTGILPFLVGDTVKALLAAAILPASWRLAGRADKAASENEG
ncbi:biotin transporter BioY [Lacisediminihabitans profunda]|uniref:Biotin transporter n=1 Tax=Lacisediminihabitans profunda TaxID=2594790 RepID=A0A5C8UUM4_9MICO|nr:biotin transporter BioY [Lacisediminihabitans profunda]TXN32011.1 biotin transporter BioY [Lacisediminihabitans profunda]